MAQDFAKAFYCSKDWLACRAAYIKSVFGLCEKCKQPGHIVHHKIRLTPENIGDLEIALGWKNLQYLCLECHNKEHGEAKTVTRDDVMFTAGGQLVPTPPYQGNRGRF